MAKAFEYMEEFALEGFEERVFAPLYVIDVLRCTFQVADARRMLDLREAVNRVLPNARTKNGYSRNAIAQSGYRDVRTTLK